MTQNIYDNDEFFQNYGQMRRSLEGLAGAQEWPVMRSMLPELKGARVLDLGCGYGWFCRFARESGAASVLGIDVSEKMLARARETTSDAAIEYRLADLETVDLEGMSFDLVYSSLAFHYVANFQRLIDEIFRALKPGGHLVFSMEHPIMTAPREKGWSESAAGERIWPVDHYFNEGARSTDWLAKGVIKQHRTIATIFNTLLRAGFTLERVEDWGPTDEQVASWPSLAEDLIRPPFLLVAARR
jgi:ubiquinone/menaquinone biosynthesis C-methylase UbiE